MPVVRTVFPLLEFPDAKHRVPGYLVIMRLYFQFPDSPIVVNPSILFMYHVFNDFTAAATSADAIFSQVNLS